MTTYANSHAMDMRVGTLVDAAEMSAHTESALYAALRPLVLSTSTRRRPLAGSSSSSSRRGSRHQRIVCPRPPCNSPVPGDDLSATAAAATACVVFPTVEDLADALLAHFSMTGITPPPNTPLSPPAVVAATPAETLAASSSSSSSTLTIFPCAVLDDTPPHAATLVSPIAISPSSKLTPVGDDSTAVASSPPAVRLSTLTVAPRAA